MGSWWLDDSAPWKPRDGQEQDWWGWVALVVPGPADAWPWTPSLAPQGQRRATSSNPACWLPRSWPWAERAASLVPPSALTFNPCSWLRPGTLWDQLALSWSRIGAPAGAAKYVGAQPVFGTTCMAIASSTSYIYVPEHTSGLVAHQVSWDWVPVRDLLLYVQMSADPIFQNCTVCYGTKRATCHNTELDVIISPEPSFTIEGHSSSPEQRCQIKVWKGFSFAENENEIQEKFPDQ